MACARAAKKARAWARQVHTAEVAGKGSATGAAAAAEAALAASLKHCLAPEWLAEADKRLQHQSELLTVRVAKAPSKRVAAAVAAAAATQLGAAVAQVTYNIISARE